MASGSSSIYSCEHRAFLVATTLAVAYLVYTCQTDSDQHARLSKILPAPGSLVAETGSIIVTDIVVFLVTLLFCALGLKWGSSMKVCNALHHCLGGLLFPASTVNSRSNGKTGKGCYTVCSPSLTDATGLQQLYNDAYIKAHIQMHPSVRGASTSDWEEALGPVDFEALMRDQSKGKADVRLLKCVEAGDSVPMEERPPLGYILYEIRTKGSPGKRPQRYCEVVNVVVGKTHQGCGLGRLLFQEMEADIDQTFKSHKGDLRLFVAKANSRPLQWYRRLGFQDAGWQKESLGKAEVPFLRMTKKTT